MLPKNRDVAIYDSRTYEDILNDCIITIIKHFEEKEISAEESWDYCQKTMLMEFQFAKHRKNRDRLILIADMSAQKLPLQNKEINKDENI